MHGLSNRIITAEAEAYVTHPTTYFGVRKVFTNPFGRTEKVQCIQAVLLHTRGYWEDVWIENDVFWWEAYLIYEHPVRTLTDLNTTLVIICLAILIKCHNNDCRTEALDGGGLMDEFFFTALQGNRINHTFSLDTLQSCLDDLPFGRVNHDGNACDIRFCSNKV